MIERKSPRQTLHCIFTQPSAALPPWVCQDKENTYPALSIQNRAGDTVAPLNSGVSSLVTALGSVSGANALLVIFFSVSIFLIKSVCDGSDNGIDFKDGCRQQVFCLAKEDDDTAGAI